MHHLRESHNALLSYSLYHFMVLIALHLKYLASICMAQYSVPLRLQGGVCQLEMTKIAFQKSDVITFTCFFDHCTVKNGDIALQFGMCVVCM